jgi:hypothetical protein
MYRPVFFSHETNFYPTAGSLIYDPRNNVHYSVLSFRKLIMYQNTQVENGKTLQRLTALPATSQNAN